MKYILICVMMLAAALMGNTFITIEKKRLKNITSLIATAKGIESHMVKRNYVLIRAFYEAEGECAEVYRACAEELRRHPEMPVRAAAMSAVRSTQKVEADIGEAIAEHMEALSGASVASQIESGTETFIEKLREMQQETKEIRMKRAGTVRNLCLFAGIALGIILI